MARGELAQRVAVAAVGIPVVVAAGRMGGWVLGALLGLVAAAGALELYRLAARRGVRAFSAAGAVAAGVLVLVVAARPAPAPAAGILWAFTVALALGLGAAAVLLRGPAGRPLAAVAVTVFGALYLGGTLAHALLLRHLPVVEVATPVGSTAPFVSAAWAGTALLFFPITLTWINDTCAFFAGRAWGRRRLSPRVSPGKTVEGAVAGLVGTVVVGVGYAAAVLDGWQGLPVSPWAGAVGGLLIAVVAQVGDLVESVFKREADVKDSGGIFPGHGGVLDRLDALLFTVPVAYWYLSRVLVHALDGGPWP